MPNDFIRENFENWLSVYKEAFEGQHWEEERYKWVAVKQFQDTWDIEAENLPGMIETALSKTENLLTSANSFPKGMIVNFANAAPEEVRAMFVDLFDEAQDVISRIERFKHRSEELRQTRMPGAKNHYQDENTITTYLWLRYPDKYYIYKFGEIREVVKALGSELVFKKGRYESNLANFYELYNAIHDELVKDSQLREMLERSIDQDCYPDPEERTLTFDFGFFVSRTFKEMQEEGAKTLKPGPDYDPGFSVEEWVELLDNKSIFDDSALAVMKRMADMGGTATCSQLAKKYGGHWNYYNGKSQAAAERIIKAKGIPQLKREDGSKMFWPILYKGKDADGSVEGVFIWTLHPALKEAIGKIDLSRIPLYETTDNEGSSVWWLNANPKIWSFAETPVGEVQTYTLFNENGNKRRVFQNFLDAKPGDIVIGYESNPVKQIVALGEIVEGSDGERIAFKKTEALATPVDYQDLKAMPELESMEFFVNPNGSLFKVEPEEYEAIIDAIRELNPAAQTEEMQPYDRASFLSEVFVAPSEYDKLARVLRKSKNLILQGAPGTGKTFAAKRLAYAMMGSKDDTRIRLVQFHQNYSYEDFVMGYKPEGDTFKLKNGVFYEFCKMAESHPDLEYFFIIDEINRGNMSKAFGELLMLIEASHRGEYATLAYNGLPFTVPGNLYIIGMMNTADRSLAMIDYALRRRFAFYEMEPAFEAQGFIEEVSENDSSQLQSLIEAMRHLNHEIESDTSLGKGFRIGHSYFCGMESGSTEELSDIVDLEIVPMLEEYWFDDEERVASWRNRLEGAIR